MYVDIYKLKLILLLKKVPTFMSKNNDRNRSTHFHVFVQHRKEALLKQVAGRNNNHELKDSIKSVL